MILDKNPLKLSDGDAMREITVLQTVKEGKTVYRKKTVDKLQGYFIKNTVKFDDDFDFMHLVITNRKDFDQYFGVAKTMTNEVDPVNFEENNVIAIATKPSKTSKKIDVVYYEFDGDKLFVQYGIATGGKNSYKSSGLYLATIPKKIKTVLFKSKDNVGEVEVK